jgi:hypothetical protein
MSPGIQEPAILPAALPEFQYMQLTLRCVQADGRPLAGASVYGFCRQLNLIWPRRDRELNGRNDVLWDESYLGKTDAGGMASVTVPPGAWRFFAAGRASDGEVVAEWSDDRERSGGESVLLVPTATRLWRFCSADGSPLAPRRLLIKPDSFPVWIPVSLGHPADSVTVALGPGRLRIWAEADATPDHPGFAMDWGDLSSAVPNGDIRAANPPALVACTGGQGHALLSWIRWAEYGLRGDIALCVNARVMLSPGSYSISYRHPIGNGMTADFAGQFYTLRSSQTVPLDFDAPLVAGVDQGMTHGIGRLIGQLYLVDANHHLMKDLIGPEGKPVDFAATVAVDGRQFTAQHGTYRGEPGRALLLRDLGVVSDNSSEAPQPQEESGFWDNDSQTLFQADIGPVTSATSAVWSFIPPPGVLPPITVPFTPLVALTGSTFKLQVPKVLVPAAINLLAQAETLGQTMNAVSGRQRRVTPTAIGVNPTSPSASSHDGSHLGISNRIFFRDQPTLVHTFVHELAHNYDFFHGGMMETVVEVCRSTGSVQITQQPAKWLFLDLMNGIKRKKTGYRNTGLYLYCYARRGPDFLHWVSAHEPVLLGKLSAKGYTVDEITDAICSLAMGRDMTPICLKWELTISPDRAAHVLADAESIFPATMAPMPVGPH